MVQEHRDHPTDYTKPFVHPDHDMETTYEYNSFNQLVRQSTPDTDKTVEFVIMNPDEYSGALGTLGNAMYDVHMFNSNDGIAIIKEATYYELYETIDGGNNWTLADDDISTLSQNGFIRLLHIRYATTLLAVHKELRWLQPHGQFEHQEGECDESCS